jgi:hypothetical protein
MQNNIITLFVSLVVFQQVFAASSVLTFVVSGTVFPSAYLVVRVSDMSTISESFLTFTFGTIYSASDKDWDSRPITLKLFNPGETSSNMVFQAPTFCKVGEASVFHVVLATGITEYSTGNLASNLLSEKGGAKITLRLKDVPEGAAGNFEGCTDGGLVYNY